MDLVKWFFGVQPSEANISQRHSKTLDQALKAVAQQVPDADPAYLKDFLGKILLVYRVDQAVKVTIDYLKASPDYPKIVHRQRRVILQEDATEESDDESNSDDVADGEVEESDQGDGETDYEGDEQDADGGEGDREDGEKDGEFVVYAADGDGWGEEELVEHGAERERDQPQQAPECGCCFSDITNVEVVHCPVGHVFCVGCLGQHASVQLTERKSILKCMDTSGCDRVFSDSDIRRHLSRELLKLYNYLEIRREVKEANIGELEECPCCDWACVMEVSVGEEPVFRCGNKEGGCGAKTCRLCKKKDHLPYPCEQGKRLTIEESMTKALLRNCPNCANGMLRPFLRVVLRRLIPPPILFYPHEAFIKEDGVRHISFYN
jgi:hypothetical protein